MTTSLIEQPKNASRFAGRWIRKETVVASAILIGCLPMLPLHLKHCWERPQYQFFPIVLCVAVWLIWKRWPAKSAVAEQGKANRLQVMLVTASAALLTAATVLFSPWLSAIAAVLITAGFMMQFGGTAWPRLLPAWALLWFTVRLPGSLDTLVRTKLQLLTSKASSLTLDLFGFDHLMEGTVLDFPNHRLFVDEACSGVQSLFAMLAFTAMYSVWARRPAVIAGLLMLSAVFWTGVMNIVRVSTIAVAFEQWEVDLSSGWQHETLGMALFAVSLAMIASTDRLLQFFLNAIHDDDNPMGQRWDWLVAVPKWGRASADSHPNDDSRRDQIAAKQSAMRGPFHSWCCAAVFLLLGAGQGWLLSLPNVWASISTAAEVAVPIDKEFLAQEYGEWRLVSFDSQQRDVDNNVGQFSKIWTYQSPEYSAIVSFDYPFKGWHELTECYRNIGWRVFGRTVCLPAGPNRRCGGSVALRHLRIGKADG